MRKTLRNILTGALAVATAGCTENSEYNFTKEESSEILNEPAVVSEVVYNPSKHGSGMGPTISLSGKVGMAFTSVTIPEKYAVVFKCQHGKFIIEGEDQRHKDLWGRFDQGDSVRVSYKEMYQSEYHHFPSKSQKQDSLVKRTLVDFDFIDAKPLRETKK